MERNEVDPILPEVSLCARHLRNQMENPLGLIGSDKRWRTGSVERDNLENGHGSPPHDAGALGCDLVYQLARMLLTITPLLYKSEKNASAVTLA
jgi:hypothetical protein